ncbi:MAG: hypothetical protein ABIH23_31695 [bacterium]
MRLDTRQALLIFLFLTLVYLLLQGAKPGYTVDADPTYQLTASILEEGTLFPQVRVKQGFVQALAYIPFYMAGDTIAGLHPGVNPDHVRRRALCWMNALLAAGTCSVLFLLCREMGAALIMSRNVALATGLSTMLLPYSRYDYNKMPAALLVTLVLLAAYRCCRRGNRSDFLLFGSWVGLLVGIRLEFLVIMPGLAWLIWLRRRPHLRPADCLPGMLVASVLIGTVLLYQWSRWGGVSGYELAFNRSPIQGLYGFAFSLGKSLFLYNPILVLLPVVLWRFRRSEWFTVWGVAVIPIVLFYAWWSNWWGGWAWGPRHLLPLVPLFAAPLAVGLTHRRSLGLECLFWHLTSLGIVLQLFGITLDFNDGILTLYNQRVTEPMLIYLWPFGGIANHARVLFLWPVPLWDFGVMHYWFYNPSTRVVAMTVGALLLAVLCLLKLRVSREDGSA